MDAHRFSIGQTARLLQSMINRGKSISCEILQIMPFDGVGFQYRVRGDQERFDRIVQEHELAEITPLESEAVQLNDPVKDGNPLRMSGQAMKGKG